MQKHFLTNHNVEARTADCAVCGPGVATKSAGRRDARKCKSAGAVARSRLAENSRYRKGSHGLTAAEAQLRAEGQVCQVCGDSPVVNDHSHVTGKLRGFLCQRCNRTLGQLGDGAEPELIFRLYLYACQWGA